MSPSLNNSYNKIENNSFMLKTCDSISQKYVQPTQKYKVRFSQEYLSPQPMSLSRADISHIH